VTPLSPDYLVMMAAYNAWQNENILTAAESLTQSAREQDRGAFFGSIFGTLNHLMWGDLLWMSRFDGGTPPDVGIPKSMSISSNWKDLKAARVELDARIIRWAHNVDPTSISGTYNWFSASAKMEVERPMTLVVAHFFNHQTHHRGQLHAMLTAAGAKPTDTDLFFMPLERLD
jgi:uncharacterized damage-inducible protein DinB